MFVLTVLFAFTFGSVDGTRAQELRAQVRLLPDDFVAVDDEVILEIKISTLRPELQISDPQFRLENLEIISGPKKDSSLRMVDGRPAASRTLTWRLAPRRVGRARVRKVEIEVEGREIELPDREIQVLRELPRESLDSDSGSLEPPWSRRASRRRERSSSTPEIFLRAEVSTSKPWVGEQVTYRLNLYTQVDIDSVNPEDMPGFKGFWVRVIPQPEDLKPQMVEIEGERFGKVVLLERALFPRRAGRLRIDPVTARMQARMSSNAPFSSGRLRSREIARDSNAVTIEVRALPEAAEELRGAFQGAVGRLQMSADLEPKKLAVGEAATLTVTLRGEGHLQGIAAPVLPTLDDLEIFPPQQRSDEEIADKVLRGTRIWSFVVVPKRAGAHQIPEIELVSFDPKHGEYRNVSTLPLSLQVEGTASVSSDGTALHPIRTAALPEPRVKESSTLPVWLLILPWPVALLLWWWRARIPTSENPRQDLLRALDAAAEESSPRPAAAKIEAAWRDFLEKRWQISRGVAGTRWHEELTAANAPKEVTEGLNQLAEDLHYLRYAPKLSPTEDLREELLERSRELARKC